MCRSTREKIHLPPQQEVILAILARLVELLSSAHIEKGISFKKINFRCKMGSVLSKLNFFILEMLQSSYAKICGKLSLPSLSRDDIYLTLSLLETEDLIRCSNKSCQLLIDANSVRDLIGDSLLVQNLGKISEVDLLDPWFVPLMLFLGRNHFN